MLYLYLKLKLEIKGIFGKKGQAQKCAERGSFLYMHIYQYFFRGYIPK